MAVVGFDFGSQNCYISIARAGGIETITNDYSLRVTPSFVSFTNKNRCMGVSSKNQALTNLKNTVFDFKNFLGRSFDESFVTEEIKNQIYPFEIVKGKNGEVEFKVDYCGESRTFSAIQITAMLFTKLKCIAEDNLKVRVTDCVVSCPVYFTDGQRRALITALKVADLNCLRLSDDLASTALAFCVYKGNDLAMYNPKAMPTQSANNQTQSNAGKDNMADNNTEQNVQNSVGGEEGQNTPSSLDQQQQQGMENDSNTNANGNNHLVVEEKNLGAQFIAFIDMGAQSLQATVCSVFRNRIKVLAVSFDSALGGRDFDMALYRHLATMFTAPGNKWKLKPQDLFFPQQSSSADLDNTANKLRSSRRLLEECVKLKKQMSANSTKLPLSLESFVREDCDISAHMQRSEFEELIAPLLKRAEKVLRALLEQSGLKPQQIDRVEIVGGCTRVPAIKQLIKTVFGLEKEPFTSLNTDEAVSTGCAIQCAMLSPTFKVRDITLINVQPYSISLLWKATGKDDGDLEIFPLYQEIPYTKQVTFCRDEPFTLEARYTYPNCIPTQETVLGYFKICVPTTTNDDTSTSPTGSKKVRVKVRLDPNGLFKVTSATATILLAKAPPTAENTESNQKEIAPQTGINKNADENQPPPTAVKKSSQSNTIEIPIENHYKTEIFEKVETINVLREIELESQARDMEEKACADAKNTLEEWLYTIRDKINDTWSEYTTQEEWLYTIRDKINDTWSEYTTQEEKDKASSMLMAVEDWLYGEGENVTRKHYADKLDSIKNSLAHIIGRVEAWNERNNAVEKFSSMLAHLNEKARLLFDKLMSGEGTIAHGSANANSMTNVKLNFSAKIIMANGSMSGEGTNAHGSANTNSITNEWDKDFQGIHQHIQMAKAWIENVKKDLSATPKHLDDKQQQKNIHNAQTIHAEIQKLENSINPLLGKLQKAENEQQNKKRSTSSSTNSNSNNKNSNVNGEPTNLTATKETSKPGNNMPNTSGDGNQAKKHNANNSSKSNNPNMDID